MTNITVDMIGAVPRPPDPSPVDQVLYGSVEYPCKFIDGDGVRCGAEAGPWGGRGRKPSFCPVHKKNRTGAKTSGRTSTNETLAKQALDTLVNIHSLGGMGFMAVGFVNTGQAIFGTEEGFREQMHPNLVANPKLCRQIIGTGNNLGMVGFFAAYAMFAGAVAPVMATEYKLKKIERDARRAEQEAQMGSVA